MGQLLICWCFEDGGIVNTNYMDEHRCKMIVGQVVSTGIFAGGFDRLNHRHSTRCLSLSKAPYCRRHLFYKFGDFDGNGQSKFGDFDGNW